MKRLTCEMCGSTDFLKQEGVFVCQSCGCKYSVEEAKKMMIEGTVEVTGTVQVDNSAQKSETIKNYLDMAQSALDGEDIEGVVSYCDRVLELDMDNYEAWTLKAKAAGWGSTLKDIKVPQALTAAKRAINLAPDAKKYDIAAELFLSIKAQIVALLSIAHSMPGVTGCEYIHRIMLHWQSALMGIPYLSVSIIEDEIEECKVLCEQSKAAWAPSARLLFSTYAVNNKNKRYDITFRENLEEKIKAEAKREAEIAEKVRLEAAAYWADHPEEKAALDAQKAELEKQRADALAPISEAEKQVDKLNEEIADLGKQYAALGMFKLKESKELTRRIDELRKAVVLAERNLEKVKAEVQEKISVYDAAIAVVEDKLLLK